MSESLSTLEPLRPTRSGLVCRLRHRQLQRGHSLTAGEIELHNTSEDPVVIEVHSSPLAYLNLIVRDAAGTLVSASYYGDLFSPLMEPYTLLLQPGDAYTGPVSLLGNVPEGRRLPGTYSVQAIYEYKGLRAVSELFSLELPAQN